MNETHDTSHDERQMESEQVEGAAHDGTCTRCGSNGHLRHGLCSVCRAEVRAARKTPPGSHAEPHESRPPAPPRPDVEPLHSPPWRRRGA